jgi:hypothetical protein
MKKMFLEQLTDAIQQGLTVKDHQKIFSSKTQVEKMKQGLDSAEVKKE